MRRVVRDILVPVLVAFGTAIGTKAVEYWFDRLQKKRKPKKAAGAKKVTRVRTDIPKSA